MVSITSFKNVKRPLKSVKVSHVAPSVTCAHSQGLAAATFGATGLGQLGSCCWLDSLVHLQMVW